jgi:hypothetical protein
MRCSAHTTPLSDSSPACMWAVRLSPSPTGLPLLLANAAEVSRFSCRKFPGVRHRITIASTGSAPAERGLAFSPPPVLPSASEHSVGAPEELFHGSIPSPPVPLSTLHPPCRHRRRMTRGQDGLLLLSCGALASPTSCRFIPALSLRPPLRPFASFGPTIRIIA